MVAIDRTKRKAEAQQNKWSGRVALIAKPGGTATGVGRYVQMLHAGLREAGVDPVRIAQVAPPLQAAGGVRRSSKGGGRSSADGSMTKA